MYSTCTAMPSKFRLRYARRHSSLAEALRCAQTCCPPAECSRWAPRWLQACSAATNLPGYDYHVARQQLADLEAALDEHALGFLRSRKVPLAAGGGTVSLPEMSRQLSAALPSLISVPFDPAEADEAILHASVEGIAYTSCSTEDMS